MQGGRALLVAVLMAGGTAGSTAVALHPIAAAAASRSVHVNSDFNGDGFPDVAIGEPGAAGSIGAVMVLYGNAHGVSSAHSQHWTLDRDALPGVTGMPGDRFGFSVAIGDFNGDGFADLAVGVFGTGDVVILYGSPRGLRAGGSQLLKGFGAVGAWALTTGDYNGDGFADLAVGEPFAPAKAPAAGRVEVHYGSAAGFTTTARGSAATFSEATRGMSGPRPGFNDNFGLALASGDFNGDGFTDLAVGAPRGNNGGGAAFVIDGSAAGLVVAHSQFLATWGAGGGGALAAGDFNADGFTDLVVGEPNTSTSFGSGTIEIHFGSATGLTRTGFGAAQLYAMETVGMPGPPSAADDRFGFALACADFNGDGFADVAIGVPGESAAIVLFGSALGLPLASAQFLPGIGPQVTSVLQPVGESLTTVAVVGSSYADLVMGEPFTNTTQPEAGVAEVFVGSPTGLSPTQLGAARVMSEDSPGMAGPASAPGDLFGFSMSAGT